MKIPGHWLRRQIAGCLMLFLAVPFGEAATALPQQTAVTQQQAQGAPSAQSQPQNSAEKNSKPDTAPSAAPPQVVKRGPQTTREKQQSGPPKPLGTAAAPYEKGVGVAASRPAGAAIAPAKQKRTRVILIRVGLLVGAAIAIGTVAALSKASPSRPH